MKLADKPTIECIKQLLPNLAASGLWVSLTILSTPGAIPAAVGLACVCAYIGLSRIGDKKSEDAERRDIEAALAVLRSGSANSSSQLTEIGYSIKHDAAIVRIRLKGLDRVIEDLAIRLAGRLDQIDRTLEVYFTENRERLDDLCFFLEVNFDALNAFLITIPANMSELRRHLGEFHDALASSKTVLARIESHQSSLVTKCDLKNFGQALLAQLQSLQSTDGSVDPSIEVDLAAAVERLADCARRGRVNAQRIFERNNPDDVADFLIERRQELDIALGEINHRLVDETLRVDQQLAAVAYTLGRFDDARAALERILLVKPRNVSAFNRMISTQTYEEALATLDRMEKVGAIPTTATYNRLIHLANDYVLGEKLVDRMQHANIKPDVMTYTTLLGLAKNYVIRDRLLARMSDARIYPNVVTYTTLISRARDNTTREKLWAEMREAGIRPNAVTYNAVLRAAKNDSDCETLLTEMRKGGIRPDVVTYSTLLRRLKNASTREALLAEMRERGIRLNVWTYNALLSRANDGIVFDNLLAEMREAKIRPDVATYTILLGRSKDDASRQALIEEMLQAKIEWNVWTYNALLRRAYDESAREKILAEMLDAKVRPNVATYNTLLEMAKDDSARERALTEMRKGHIRPQISLCYTAIIRAKSYQAGRRIFEEMCKANQTPNTDIYNALIGLARDSVTADELIAEMRQADKRPSIETYNMRMKLSTDIVDGEHLIMQMRAEGIRPSVLTYKMLIQRAKNFADGERIMAQMLADQVEPDPVVYTSLLSLDVGDRSAAQVLDWYRLLPHHPEAGISALFAQFRKRGQDDQALYIALRYPHNPAVLKYLRRNLDKAIKYFEDAWKADPSGSNTSYALGIIMQEAGRHTEASHYLRVALDTANSVGRRADINRRLAQMSSG